MKRGMLLISVGVLVSAFSSATAFGGDIHTDGKLVSTAATGPPLQVASSQVVGNLELEPHDRSTILSISPR